MDDKAQEPSVEPQTDVLPLNRYAEISAHLVHFKGSDLGEVVSRLGVLAPDWDRAFRHWTAAVGAELSRQDMTLTLAMGPVFASTKARLEAERPTIESLGPRIEDSPAELEETAPQLSQTPALSPPPAESAPMAEPRPAPAIAAAVPSFMLQPRPSGEVPSFMRAPAPAAVVVAVPPASPPAMIARPLDTSDEGDTRPAATSELWEPTLPFEGAKGRSRLQGTSLALDPPKQAPVPFQGPSETVQALDSAKRHAESAQGPKKPASSVGGTEMSSDIGAIARKILPFGGAAERPRAGPAQAPAPARAAPAPMMSVEQYASLCVEVSLAPAAIGDVLRRYGLTEVSKKGLDDHWEHIFKVQPTQYLAWDRACKAYRAWLESTRSGGR